MQLCGWKRDAMFKRYTIVDERDLRSAVEMLAGSALEERTISGGELGRPLPLLQGFLYTVNQAFGPEGLRYHRPKKVN